MDATQWSQLSLMQQLGNIGAEIGRASTWKKTPVYGNFQEPFYRGLTYLDYTICDRKNAGPRRKELCRLREALVDWHYGSLLYHTTIADWDKYFSAFAIAANRR